MPRYVSFEKFCDQKYDEREQNSWGKWNGKDSAKQFETQISREFAYPQFL